MYVCMYVCMYVWMDVFWHIAVFDESLSQNTLNVNEFLVSKETVVLRRWERSKTKIIESFALTKG